MGWWHDGLSRAMLQWHKGMMHGRGKFTNSVAATYEGEWVRGMREGRGRLVFPDGTFFDGQWQVSRSH